MGKARIIVYYDVVRYLSFKLEMALILSPYAYMGVEILRRYRDFWGGRVDVEFIPFFLGGIMVGAKNRPPISVPGNHLLKVDVNVVLAKGVHTTKDMARSGKIMGMPKFCQPSIFPIQSYKVECILHPG